MDLGLLFYFFLFLIAIFISFFVPGNIFVARLPLNNLQKGTLSITFGIVLWALQGFLFGYLHIRWLTYLYIIGFFIVWVIYNKHKFTYKHIQHPTLTIKNALFVGFVTLAIVTQLITTFANGISTSKGIYFCCGLPDSLFHIALTSELVNHFPPREPGISDVMLHNYHFLPNLVNADLIRIYHIPLLYLQFPYSSILLTILLALNLIAFAQLSIKKRSFAYWLLFFVFFSGDLLFLLTLFTYKEINFNTAFLENAAWLWISPPRVYAATLFFGGLSMLYLWLQKSNLKTLGFIVALTFGSLIGFKVYFGIFALVGLAALLPFYIKDKDIKRIIVIISAFFVSACLYLPINSDAGGFIFTGFWRFNDFADFSPFGLQKMELARYVYLSHGNWQHALLNSLIYFILYFLFIFGTLLISFLQTKSSLSYVMKKLHIFLIAGFIICFICGSFFIQTTGTANSSQFLITDMIVMSVYAAFAAYYWLQKVKNNKVLVIIISVAIIGFTAPRVIYENIVTISHIKNEIGFTIDNKQLAALNYLRSHSQQNSIVLQNNVTDCIYVTFISQRQTFLCLDGAPGDRGVLTANRSKKVNDIFGNNKLGLIPSSVNYLYLPTNQYSKKKKLFNKYGFKTFFSNSEITIVRIR